MSERWLTDESGRGSCWHHWSRGNVAEGKNGAEGKEARRARVRTHSIPCRTRKNLWEESPTGGGGRGIQIECCCWTMTRGHDRNRAETNDRVSAYWRIQRGLLPTPLEQRGCRGWRVWGGGEQASPQRGSDMGSRHNSRGRWRGDGRFERGWGKKSWQHQWKPCEATRNKAVRLSVRQVRKQAHMSTHVFSLVEASYIGRLMGCPRKRSDGQENLLTWMPWERRVAPSFNDKKCCLSYCTYATGSW
jgi:hypothetical protein